MVNSRKTYNASWQDLLTSIKTEHSLVKNRKNELLICEVITTDTMVIKRIIKDCYEKLHAHKFHNIDNSSFIFIRINNVCLSLPLYFSYLDVYIQSGFLVGSVKLSCVLYTLTICVFLSVRFNIHIQIITKLN